jgi:hypothetical protein
MSFSGGRGLECLRVAMEHDLYKSLGDVNMCRKFNMFEIKVPIIFFGTPVFPARRDGRYNYISSLSFSLNILIIINRILIIILYFKCA